MSQFVDDNGTAIPDNKVTALPTKRFFMSMLSRDIALNDAIMDLLDNCIDGIHRQNPNQVENSKEKYKGYFGKITLDKDGFTLTDNCGGIPLKTAKEYAFKMGRSDKYKDDDGLETIGMYGIGMKRAIFKMGMKAEIYSYTKQDAFKVTVPENWESSDDWYFDFETLTKNSIKAKLPTPGTTIHVTALNENIKTQFSDEVGYITDLRIDLEKHYGYIIKQGFQLTVNETPIKALDINILTSERRSKGSISPYFYSDQIGGVKVDVIVGFYRGPATNSEMDQDLEGNLPKRESEKAGITVLCNDRIVLYADRTFLTGWGEFGMPKYHTQFISIAGVAHFRAKNSLELPVTTTKRGLDTSSPVYAEVKNRIKEGIKYFTDFTNKWKSESEERTALFSDLKPIAALSLGHGQSELISATDKKRNDEGIYQLPDLPKPVSIVNNDIRSITFKRHKDQIAAVRDTFIANPNVTPGDVGAWCFDELYKQTI
ncbi:ATP-binding protein [Mucilaginibacter terrae]|uniref:ATP-binding protein n=1 Tax=Mucilaginibacter terrae TaxID=1955052 RepID=UPI00363DC271